MTKYLDPKVDVLFKKIFGENKELLISFLNSLLPLKEGQEIVSIEYLSPEQVPDTLLGKNSIVDVKCVDNTERTFIVEMQMDWTNMFRKRLLINGSKAVIRQLDKKKIEDKAKKFQELKPVYVLAVVDSTFSQGKDWYHHLQIVDLKNPDLVIDGLDYVLLELPKFTPETWSYAHKKLAVLWLRFLKEMGGYCEKLPDEFVDNELIYSAVKICEMSALTPAEWEAYDRAEDLARWQDSIKGLEDDAIEAKKLLVEKDKSLAESRKAMEEKDKSLAESKKAMAEKDKSLAEKDREIEELRKLLGSGK